ncbi:hypothetical protein JTE90_021777 [Oedothorax gibbosus]|uniref:Tubulin epsilon chain n=1 Tax=Oedothorax gibbosus TaxID=931172 RepID=A0AAV6UQV6_9ARAC|nr:hypothetical protein JTE90_021777 [Oedothorax gibbosus]
MPQSIFIQVGQCGNQIGYRFWDLALKEYKFHKTCIEDMDNFFKVCDTSRKFGSVDPTRFKARAVLVDMEEGVISEVLKGPLGHIFDKKQLVTDVSGSGNNWAVGNKFYGRKYQDCLIDLFRKEAEECESLQCFFLLHSMGGGTGSGLGTAVLEYLYDEFPRIPRFVFPAFPSLQDDVITSPYNTVLANSQLIKFADCVIPFQNKALIDVCNRDIKKKRYQIVMDQTEAKLHKKHIKIKPDVPQSITNSNPFDEMNDVIANAILNLTCSSRFPGSLNVDINEIIMNMTPYPRLHYLIPSAYPLFPLSDNCRTDQMFNEAFSNGSQLFNCGFNKGLLLASSLLCRGKVSMSDVQHNIERLKGTIKFVPWNGDGWKIGLCKIPPIFYSHSILILSNTSSIILPFSRMQENFLKMYKKKAHLHHFLEVEGMENDTFMSSLDDLVLLIDEYAEIERVTQVLEQSRVNIQM